MSVKIAVIGCGQWGQNHVRTLAELGALAAVADRDGERAGAFARRYGVRTAGAEELLLDASIDALVLALPARLHGPMARRAFAAGKHVFIEKPIALDPQDAAATVAASQTAGRHLMVGHVLRFHPVFTALAAAVRQGRIGSLRHIASTRLGLGRFLGMDVVWDLAPHDLSLVLHLAGSCPDTVEAVRRTVLSDAADIADIHLGFPDGLSAEIHLSRVSPNRDRRLAVVGSEGMLVWDDLAPEGSKLAFHDHRVWREGSHFAFHAGEAEPIETEAGMPLTLELQHFLDCIATGRPPETGADEALETVRILAIASPDPA